MEWTPTTPLVQTTQAYIEIVCPEFHSMLWQRQSSPTNCVPTAIRMILRARGKLTDAPDAGPQGVQGGSEAAAMAFWAGFKIVDASEYSQNVPKAATGYGEMLRKTSFVAIRSYPTAGLGHARRDYTHAVVVVGISLRQNQWRVHFYDPGLPDPDWRKVQTEALGDFAAVVEEWWLPDWR
jgi:hypothetical protein